MKQKKIYVLSGYHYHPDEGEHDIITAVFSTCEAAAREVLKRFQETFPDESDLFTLEGCMCGNDYCNGAYEQLKLTIEEFSINVEA